MTGKSMSLKRYMEIKDYFLEQNLGNITDEELDRKIILKD
jgi:hypothetical protein